MEEWVGKGGEGILGSGRQEDICKYMKEYASGGERERERERRMRKRERERGRERERERQKEKEREREGEEQMDRQVNQ